MNKPRYRFRRFLLIVAGLLKGIPLSEIRKAMRDAERRGVGNAND